MMPKIIKKVHYRGLAGTKSKESSFYCSLAIEEVIGYGCALAKRHIWRIKVLHPRITNLREHFAN